MSLHRRSYRPQATVRTWLYSIARTLCLNLLRKEKVIQGVHDSPRLHLRADPSPHPEQRLGLVEQEEAVRQASRGTTQALIGLCSRELQA